MAVSIYYCNHCKKIVKTLDDLFFVENSSSRSFCSEGCIESFFNHLIVYYSDLEKNYRLKLNLVNEPCLKYASAPAYMEKVLKNPQEIWCSGNDLNEKVYSLISKFEGDERDHFYFIVFCFVFNDTPSFVFITSTTQNEKLLQHLRIGKRVDDFSENVMGKKGQENFNYETDPKIISLLDQKKSEMLSYLLKFRLANDISFDEFAEYEDFFQETLDSPDDIYCIEEEDDESFRIFSYIKAHENGKGSFYYIILSIQFNNLPQVDGEALYPLLFFPSIDPELCKLYKKGKLVSGSLKN